jgi:polyphosphate kinase
MATAGIKKAVDWLIQEIEERGVYPRTEVIDDLQNKFGDYCIHQNNGQPKLADEFQRLFRKRKHKGINWNISTRSWHYVPNAERTQERPDPNEIPVSPTFTNHHIPSAVEPRPVPKNARVDDPTLYLNRELGWLDFNWRVLYQATDKRIPLLDRVRFIAITASNLDEFIQKRVGGLKRQQAAGVESLTPDGRTPSEQIRLIQEVSTQMVHKYTSIWRKQLVPLLEKEADIRISDYGSLNKTQRQELDDYFMDHIYPILTPLAVDPGHPFPFISNLSLSLAVMMKHPNRDATHFARVKIPSNHPRMIRVRNSRFKHHYISIEEVIRYNVDKLFRGMDVQNVSAFRVTRNADIRRDEEEADDLLSMISEELRERRYAPVVRLEVENDMRSEVLNILRKQLGLSDPDIIKVKGPLDLTCTFELADLNLPRHKSKNWQPVVPKRLAHEGETEDEQNIFDIIRQGDLLVHHPYESFNASVRRLIEEAASDPKVIAIKQTLYRTSDDSPVVKALTKAAERGKQVAVLVEVKARFDEANNIEWGKMLENAGVHVAYGLIGLKTHAKVALVIRKEEEGPVAYCHIGTGNYHVKTAGIYTDMGLLTCDEDIGYDITNIFHYLTGHAPEQHYKKLMVAPVEMRDRFNELIDREIAHQKKYSNGRIIAKMNALDDIRIIQRLYKASQAGVTIDLIIRGHSRLRPGVPGYSDNIRLISIIGRFLEHDRVFYFGNNGDPDIYIGSCDWRNRNLTERVEAAVPITNQAAKARIERVLEYALEDNRLAWDLKSDGSYTQRAPNPGEKERNFHQFLMNDAVKRAAD